MGFKERLAEIINSGVSKNSIAEAINVNRRTIDGWLEGKEPGTFKFIRLAKFLNQNPLWLASGIEEKEENIRPEILKINNKLEGCSPDAIKKISEIINLICEIASEDGDQTKF